jgi:hypothetical protein
LAWDDDPNLLSGMGNNGNRSRTESPRKWFESERIRSPAIATRFWAAGLAAVATRFRTAGLTTVAAWFGAAGLTTIATRFWATGLACITHILKTASAAVIRNYDSEFLARLRNHDNWIGTP